MSGPSPNPRLGQWFMPRGLCMCSQSFLSLAKISKFNRLLIPSRELAESKESLSLGVTLRGVPPLGEMLVCSPLSGSRRA